MSQKRKHDEAADLDASDFYRIAPNDLSSWDQVITQGKQATMFPIPS